MTKLEWWLYRGLLLLEWLLMCAVVWFGLKTAELIGGCPPLWLFMAACWLYTLNVVRFHLTQRAVKRINAQHNAAVEEQRPEAEALQAFVRSAYRAYEGKQTGGAE